MDTLYWTQFSRKIKIEHASKKYFNDYLYKMVVHAPYGRTINLKNAEIFDSVKLRKSYDKEFNRYGYWGRKNPNLGQEDVAFLECIRDIKNNNSIDKKIRIEEPLIQIYTATENDLKSIVNRAPSLFKKHTQTITGPGDANCESILNSGAIIKTVDNGYRYKIILRDGSYSPEIKEQLLNYFNNVGKDEVKVTAGLGRFLSNSSTTWLWNSYIYVNDLSIITFINLICPKLVGNIHELVVIAGK